MLWGLYTSLGFSLWNRGTLATDFYLENGSGALPGNMHMQTQEHGPGSMQTAPKYICFLNQTWQDL